MPTVKDKNFKKLAAAINEITNAETDIIATNAVIIPFPTAHILVRGSVQVTQGASAGTVTVKIYRGADHTGTLVYTSDALSIGAAARLAIPFDFQEDLNGAANAQYALTVTDNQNQSGNNVDQAVIT